MLKEYELNAEDERIIDELDNLCGVVQNKEILKDMIIYTKLRKNGEIDFGNYNILVRNDSDYLLLDDLLKVVGKILLRHHIISNDRICYLDRAINKSVPFPLDYISGIEESIIVISEKKLRIDIGNDIERIKKILNLNKDKVFIFEDQNWSEGFMDAELGNLVSWRMTIDKITLEDKIMYCRNIFEKNNIKYKRQEIKEFADQPFWKVRNQVMQLIIECKSKDIKQINNEMLKKKSGKTNNNVSKRKVFNKEKTKTKAKEELDKLIGLNGIKDELQKILNYVKLNKERGEMPTLHMCFTGNPGTGKTSVARIIGKLFDEENILPGNGEFVEIHGRDLVAEYVGWTAQKVHETIEKAMGGVLFIDEAYSLVSRYRGSFEDEAIATLIKEMEDHRNEICIILAGYTEEMKELIKLNPGFESRIQFTIDFPDYTSDELMQIFNGLCKKEKYKLATNCEEILINNFERARREEDFGNGRYVRNIFEKAKFEQSNRVAKTNSKNLNTITSKDIINAINNMNTNHGKTKRVIGF